MIDVLIVMVKWATSKACACTAYGSMSDRRFNITGRLARFTSHSHSAQ
jgi:hypothetical protein